MVFIMQLLCLIRRHSCDREIKMVWLNLSVELLNSCPGPRLGRLEPKTISKTDLTELSAKALTYAPAIVIRL